jgi:hypothetical protein
MVSVVEGFYFSASTAGVPGHQTMETEDAALAVVYVLNPVKILHVKQDLKISCLPYSTYL